MPLSFPLVAIHPETHDVVLELVYASPNNVAGRPLYGRALCLLHRDADECLRRAVQIAAARGYRLKIFVPMRRRSCCGTRRPTKPMWPIPTLAPTTPAVQPSI